MGTDREDRGRVAYHAGASAEDSIAADYERRGFQVSNRRWRGVGGEIDLVARGRDGLVFIEVKKARDFARAAARVSARQMERLCAAAEEFLGQEPGGLLTYMRFDVALVNASGEHRIVENAFGAA